MDLLVDDFKNITLLITHYNRSQSLERLLNAFHAFGYHFGHIIVSDDASSGIHLEKLSALQERYSFELASTKVNKGLANNINKGQSLVKTPLTLYVQEDFVPKPLFKEKLKDAVNLMDEKKDLDLIRFYAYYRYPYLTEYKKGFSEMNFRIWYRGYRKFHLYSDHPHLRRSDFLKKFGKYQEGIKSDVAEYKMMQTFLKRKGKALFYDNFKDLFDQINSEQEPSTVKRNFWRNSNDFLVVYMRHLYRHLKFNIDYLF
jgi:glycosyltransferase involved in cell wall biosynthesis